MLSDDAKLRLATRYLRRKYTGPKQSSGALVADKVYLIVRFKSGDDFRNVGADENESNRNFTATGTAPAWTHGSILQELKLAELLALSETLYSAATKTVTLTRTGFEGGDAGGEITFERAIAAIAVQNLIEEFDPDYSLGRDSESCGSVVRFC